MPWKIYRRERRLEVDLDGGVRGAEWEELLDDLVRRLNLIERVIFLLPRQFEGGDQVQHLDSLVQVLAARGVNVERRHVS
jgi:alpha-D-ribose 1-methylphosphonate 5-triphosphate synthase subunit PhnL